ncbi:MAG: transcription termination/antitermination protein NusA [Erysipelotrichia bacterium]|jgi:N utilization substance protein A|nr:transcription termination/antitermination protein NusA [Erysipelotrichia bacterium]
MNIKDLMLLVANIETTRSISKEIVVAAVEEALAKAYRKQIEIPDAIVRVQVNENGDIQLFQRFLVVEEVEDDELEISLKDAQARVEGIQLGDFIDERREMKELGRAAALLAKNVLKQKIREAEKAAIFDEYEDKKDEMVIAAIESVEEKFVVVNLGKTLAMMPKAAQIPNERYIEGSHLRVVITEVNKETKGAQVLVSRADAKLVRRLFEKEVPEIYEGLVEIKAIAREAGERTKIAVFSKNSDIDPIGACIGPRGSRVQVVIDELKGEKIDIFLWSENSIELIKNALAPAQILAVFPHDENRGLMVVVDDSQLSLAIGKKGKNAKLAVKLTGQKIDIKSKSDAEAAGINFMERYENYMASVEAKLAEKQLERAQREAARKQEALEKAALERLFNQQQAQLEAQAEVVQPVEVEEDQPVEVKEAETQVEVKPEVKSTKPVAKEAEKVVEKRVKREIKKRDAFVSKFEKLADASKVEVKKEVKKKKYFDRDKDKEVEHEPRINVVEILKQKEIVNTPVYTDEELADLKRQELEEDFLWKDDIDYDEYDEYYEEE